MELLAHLNCLPPQLKPGHHFHLLGLGGVAMTALAGLLLDKGYKVTGSDENIYPPMQGIIESLGIKVTKGYGPDTLPPDCVVVVGNVVTRKFPVVETLIKQGHYYLSLPQILGELFLNKTKNIIAAGCHGKTTVTDLAAKILDLGGLSPGFLIGGVSLDFPRSYRLGQDWFVIEGDEYDSAFFQKVPKFIFYKPQYVILTGVEFDHGDIYPDLNAVIEAYKSLILLLPPGGLLLANGDDPIVRDLAQFSAARVEFYGQGVHNDWVVSDFSVKNGFSFNLNGPGVKLALNWSRPGLYNALNAAAVLAAAIRSGIVPELLPPFLGQIKGVKRRQEVLGQKGGIRVIDDFAHHPTAVGETIKALKQAYNGR
jgi:UDP-N-acetylmuramate: L-alanyl-gamma-D-glutamyl-meso-diaminopimelate ligase